MRNLFCRLLLVSALIALIGSVSVRLRADKKAMRNSLVRFGKRGVDDFMFPFNELSDPYEYKNPTPFPVAYVNRFSGSQDQF
ncbi:hypothetical protein L596_003278 [Steinernema carpocapsae]|uniref:Uncharacterized protein n=1 Tax=Steinernema carpocapsae TaxID=34508 RepID=A0A4U8US28_STECR|nr:hypothetical protein L596_003278 [Steinernema carpocapsae]